MTTDTPNKPAGKPAAKTMHTKQAKPQQAAKPQAPVVQIIKKKLPASGATINPKLAPLVGKLPLNVPLQAANKPQPQQHKNGGRDHLRGVSVKDMPHGNGNKPAAPARKAHLTVLPLGGVGEIGMNMTVYGCDGHYIVVDAGQSFPNFEDCPGTDSIIPDTRFLREHFNKVEAFFLTHAHEDHIGAVAYLWEELGKKAYVSPFAKLVLEDKLQQMGINPHKGEDKNRIVEIKEGVRYKAGPFEVEFVEISHSIPEPFGLAIHTPYGTIFHTGDYKFDPKPLLGNPANVKRLEELGNAGILAMVGDSTGAYSPKSAGSESDLPPAFDELLARAKNKVFFSAFASNTGRIINIIEQAAKHGRRTCLLGRTALKFIDHAKKLGYFPGSLTNHLISAEEVAGMKREKVLIFASGTQGEAQASMNRLSQGQVIKGVKIERGDMVICSSKMIPGNERAILDVLNRMIGHGAEVVLESMAKVHVSGHGGKPDMKRMYELLKPKVLIPVHGEEGHLVEQARWGKECGIPIVLPIRNGRMASLAGEGDDFVPHLQEHIYPHGRNYVDGLNILDQDVWILQDRKKLAFNGLVVCAVAVQAQTRKLVGSPSISTMGLIDPKLQKGIMDACYTKTQELMTNSFKHLRIDDPAVLQEAIGQTLKRIFSTERGKKPVVVVQVVEV
ncbi:MAG: ribonuclease J [Alphaproteobacteria bacterium]